MVMGSKGSYPRQHKKLEYYSFDGVISKDVSFLFNNCSSLKIVPQLNLNTATDASFLFTGCNSLEMIPILDVSSSTSLESAFYGCYSLKKITQLDASSCTKFNEICYNCKALQSVSIITSNNVDSIKFYYTFRECNALQSVSLDFSKMTTTDSYLFAFCYSLAELDITNMKVSFSLSNSPMLSQSELVKVLNNLATVETTQTLTLGSTNLAKLTEEDIAIAQNKGWSVA